MHLCAFVAVVMVSLVGCIEPVDARWQLDHSHVIAARATPPRIMPGETAVLDALVAHDGALTAIAIPTLAATPAAPAELEAMVKLEAGNWTLTAPDAERIASSKPAMGIPTDAPLPVDVVMTFPAPDGKTHYVKKTVWLGERAAHPVVPALTIGGAPAGSELVVPRSEDVYVSLDVPSEMRVNWFTSCGSLFQDDVATAFLRVLPEDRCDGELAVVVRAPDGGVAWQVWPIRAAD